MVASINNTHTHHLQGETGLGSGADGVMEGSVEVRIMPTPYSTGPLNATERI
jgi:hypothetical protein